MLKEKFIACLFLVVLTFQFIPIKEVVSLYYDNQLVEEVCQSTNADEKNVEGNELKKNELYNTTNPLTIVQDLTTTATINNYEEFYISRLADDAPTRPPLPSVS